MSLYRTCLRPLLFRFDAETVHGATLRLAEVVGTSRPGRALLRSLFQCQDDRLASEVAGILFPNPIGLAAGFDKNGRAIHALSEIGFGSVEIGSVSALPSAGNPGPRLFRLPADAAIVVNYGVPNDGAAVVARRVNAAPTPVPLGVNLVETNTGHPADPDAVVGEFVEAARPFCGRADYLTLNLNCPNTTAGISPFDDSGRLRELLSEYTRLEHLPPVFLKFTAHRDPARADVLLEAVAACPFIAGFIFNLPPGKAYALRTPTAVTEPMPGTLCGAPTRTMMDDTIRFWYGRIDRTRQIIVGSGGINGAAEAYHKIRLGASLLQIYSALVFDGPGLVGRIHRGLLQLLDRDGLTHLSQAVGIDHGAPSTRVSRMASANGP
ncbi:MAG: quinone-dependent dihydroorotate dehydrogenase [Candidatus Latescibacteria bacterium]|jgi:dihydroorotate dehydrogenase (fumarate)/dihydroorotate dehydrogenase|nr:quinone-dependent dihydroorotate dehydrogenase [Candidatus Latescibacterota bacterium]MDP7448382.1 quinone-dependent dihydroorotate dehydrogenase [Candidatus Latescibacterota bacterium]HJP29475.1 quinone-dependent dihydroorotate dehydrogenase [Candidatus Latescibacterota bacterium]